MLKEFINKNFNESSYDESKESNKLNNYYNFKNYNNLFYDIFSNINRFSEYNISKIVGIPRSGMLPAYILGNIFNVKVYTINEWLNNIEGCTTLRPLKEDSTGNVLIIDDSICSGQRMNQIKDMLKNKESEKYIYAAVYATKRAASMVDIPIEIVEQPRIFEWNYLNHPFLSNWCLDIDGVICIDPTEEENDDGIKYINFLKTAKPLFIPNYPVGAFVTSRLEKYRTLTEAWLNKYNIKYSHLIMLNLESKEERIRLNAHGKIKADYYASKPNFNLFIESNPNQAQYIAENTGKQVICVSNSTLYNPETKIVDMQN